MTNCIFVEEGEKFVCQTCGFSTKLSGLRRNCPKSPPPSIIKRTGNFVKAATTHVMTGMKHCSIDDRNKRLEICSSNQCNLFRKVSPDSPTGVCAHDDCGCFIRSNGKFMDKLSWAESKCPVGLWGPVEPKNVENPENGV